MGVTNDGAGRERRPAPDDAVRGKSRLTRCAEVAAMVGAGCGLILAGAKLVEVFLS
ncbi:hypothetical protein [Micromonospora aurantiaca (nom. illeg.)]|uniref:hypothetical protein n=1 Tax=Micromonospora aurantiaca (nom. illeg.) TaxID=47850 RepID=UPI001657407B|nr:hypothetical protein [Micromonospora aurantiaca]